MLFSTGQRANGQMFRSPLQLTGLAAGDPTVTAMQVALANLAQRSLNPLGNPGAATGEVNDQTLAAIANSLDLLTRYMDSITGTAFKAAILVGAGATGTDAKTYVGQYAGVIATAANAAAAALPAPPVFSSIAYDVQTSPWILLVIAGAAFVGYRLFFSKPSVAPSVATHG